MILKKLNVDNLYNCVDSLIVDKKKLLNLQKKNYLNFKFTHKYISTIIDKIRKSFFINNKLNSIHFHRKKIFKILHITNFNHRFNGRLHYNTGRRFNNGFIRLGHNVLTLSDRDIINKNKNITDFNGKKSLQRSIIDSYSNFKADCIILGHADSVSLETLDYN